MLWFKLGWRNIWRNPGRTLIQLLAIAGSLALIIWLQNLTRGSYNKMIEEGVRVGSGHLSLHHPQYLDQRLPELTFDVEEGLKILENQPQIAARMPRLHISGLARSSHEAKAAMILGVDFAAETPTNPLFSAGKIIEGNIPASDSKNLAFIGMKLSESLRLKVGNKLVVMMQNFKGEITSKLFRIGGIFKSGVTQIDNTTIFVDRKSLAKTLGNEKAVHEIALILSERSFLPQTLKEVSRACSETRNIAVFPWEVTSKQLADTIKMDHSQLKVMIFIFFLLVTIGTVNLMLMSVLERTREFGLLQALGLGRKRIKTLIFAEALVLGIAGSSAGFILGSLFSLYTWHYGLDFSSMFGAQEVAGMLFEPVIKSAWEWEWMFGLSFLMILLVIIASLYPANKALKIRPSEAMRSF